MFAEQFQDDREQVDRDCGLLCTFCENETGPRDSRTFVFGRGVGSSGGICCGECAHRMGVTGAVDVCPFCFLPILDNPRTLPNDDEVVVCDYCIEILEGL